MKRMRIAGLCLAAVFAFSAVVVASASAELPPGQFGKCVAKAGGKYANSGCTEEKAGATKFEWTALKAGETVSLTSKMKEATSATLETEKGTKITCKVETGTGAVTNNAEGRGEAVKVFANFKECSSSGVPCQNKASGEIETNELSGVTGVEKAGEKEGKLVTAKDKMAEELHGPGGGLLAKFECGGFAIEVRGSVLHGVASGKMLSETTEKFTATKGEQKPECFQKEFKVACAKDEHILESNTAGGPFEEAGQTITALVKFSEKVELNPILG